MNIFIHEMREYRKSTFIWTLSICAIIVVFLSIFPAFTKDAEQLKKVMDSFPDVIKKGLSIDPASFASLLGFYAYIFLYITLCGSIQAMNIGVSVMSKEISGKTADFLLTKPVSRSRILTSKLLAVLTSILITDVIFFIVSVLAALFISTEPFSIKVLFMVMITLFFVQLFFVAIGILFSAVAHNIRSVISVSLTTVFSFFIINMFGSIIGEAAIRYFTPFKYYDTNYIIKNSTYEFRFIILEAIVVVTAIIASYAVFSRKDIQAT
jgi:ABC-2 type transport system permease protein